VATEKPALVRPTPPQMSFLYLYISTTYSDGEIWGSEILVG